MFDLHLNPEPNSYQVDLLKNHRMIGRLLKENFGRINEVSHLTNDNYNPGHRNISKDSQKIVAQMQEWSGVALDAAQTSLLLDLLYLHGKVKGLSFSVDHDLFHLLYYHKKTGLFRFEAVESIVPGAFEQLKGRAHEILTRFASRKDLVIYRGYNSIKFEDAQALRHKLNGNVLTKAYRTLLDLNRAHVDIRLRPTVVSLYMLTTANEMTSAKCQLWARIADPLVIYRLSHIDPYDLTLLQECVKSDLQFLRVFAVHKFFGHIDSTDRAFLSYFKSYLASEQNNIEFKYSSLAKEMDRVRNGIVEIIDDFIYDEGKLRMEIISAIEVLLTPSMRRFHYQANVLQAKEILRDRLALSASKADKNAILTVIEQNDRNLQFYALLLHHVTEAKIIPEDFAVIVLEKFFNRALSWLRTGDEPQDVKAHHFTGDNVAYYLEMTKSIQKLPYADSLQSQLGELIVEYLRQYANPFKSVSLMEFWGSIRIAFLLKVSLAVLSWDRVKPEFNAVVMQFAVTFLPRLEAGLTLEENHRVLIYLIWKSGLDVNLLLPSFIDLAGISYYSGLTRQSVFSLAKKWNIDVGFGLASARKEDLVNMFWDAYSNPKNLQFLSQIHNQVLPDRNTSMAKAMEYRRAENHDLTTAIDIYSRGLITFSGMDPENLVGRGFIEYCINVAIRFKKKEDIKTLKDVQKVFAGYFS